MIFFRPLSLIFFRVYTVLCLTIYILYHRGCENNVRGVACAHLIIRKRDSNLRLIRKKVAQPRME